MLKESRGSQGQRAGHCGVPTFDDYALYAVLCALGLRNFGRAAWTTGLVQGLGAWWGIRRQALDGRARTADDGGLRGGEAETARRGGRLEVCGVLSLSEERSDVAAVRLEEQRRPVSPKTG